MRYSLCILVAISWGLTATLSCVRDGGLTREASQENDVSPTVRLETPPKAVADNAEAVELANTILQGRIARCLRVGFAKPNDDVFLMELHIHVYQAALDSNDTKLKALIAIEAIRSMPHVVKVGEEPLSEAEKEKRFRQNPDYVKLKAWYLDLIRKKR